MNIRRICLALCAALLLLFSATISSARETARADPELRGGVARSGDIAHEPCVRGICWHLLRQARLGFGHGEHAAFIVRTPSGGLTFIPWTAESEPDMARWEGPIPEGTVAIVHTHPNWLPMPSRTDALSARLGGIPIYVITRGEISKTDGDSAVVVVKGEWKPVT